MKKKWDLQSRLSLNTQNFDKDNLIKTLLENRGLKTKKQVDEFLNPSMKNLTTESLGIDKKELKKSLERIKNAIKDKEKIIVFGDYDADGICGTAIVWETLDKLKADVMPYIPHRIDEGYGLSIKGIDNLLIKYPDAKLIITVDNGIVANKAVDYANSLGIDVIITDHHVPGKSLPKAHSVVHSTLICGAGVAWFLSKQVINNKSYLKSDERLGLAAIATVTDVMRLTGFNRLILKFGLVELQRTKRPGILAVIKSAGIDQKKIGVYELGHIIGPKLNATGRLEHAIDSLRLLCTKDVKRADELAQKMNTTNLERQRLTLDTFLHAKDLIKIKNKRIIFVFHSTYEPGVIGLVAGKLTEEFYLPSVVLAVGEEYAKASARSIAGFNIIEFIRLSQDLLVDVGGHPMAAGFTIETKNIEKLKEIFEKLSVKHITDDLLIRKLKIDCELGLELVNDELFEEVQKLSPFGPGNPEPTFLAKDLIIENIRSVGKEGKHLKLKIKSKISNVRFDAILFGYDQGLSLVIGDRVDVVYAISVNEWNGNRKIELKIKDIKKPLKRVGQPLNKRAKSL